MEISWMAKLRYHNHGTDIYTLKKKANKNKLNAKKYMTNLQRSGKRDYGKIIKWISKNWIIKRQAQTETHQ